MKLCKDCKHLKSFERCVIALSHEDPVTGLRYFRSAAQERQTLAACGPSGRNFEPKPIRWWQFWRRK